MANGLKPKDSYENMARSDLLLTLVRAGTAGDGALFRKAVEAIIAEERGKRHEVLADQLESQLRSVSATSPNGNGNGHSHTATWQKLHDLWSERTPYRRLGELLLPKPVLAAVAELVEEQQRSELLRSHNLAPRHRMLLAGAPGNGKTTLAEAVAEALAVPLVVARYEGLIGSYLGETASRIKRLFDFARARACVLFFDEFDAVGKERGDSQETGEIKRVVSSLLLQVDELPPYVVVVTATNHPELLDRAVWRRFQLRLELPPPTAAEAVEFLRRMEQRTGLTFGLSPKTVGEKLRGLSFGELEEFAADVLRRHVLEGPQGDMKRIVASRLLQWRDRFALKK